MRVATRMLMHATYIFCGAQTSQNAVSASGFSYSKGLTFC